MKTLLITLVLLSSSLQAQVCGTPVECYQIEQQRKSEALRLKQEQEETLYRQQQLELEAAQLQELEEQRALLEEELAEMNESQRRLEELERIQLKRNTPEVRKKPTRKTPTQ